MSKGKDRGIAGPRDQMTISKATALDEFNATPLISVIIPAFNAAGFIRRSVDSAIRQTEGNIEIIVVDDASSDATVDIVKSYSDPRVRLKRHDSQRGASAARNSGIRDALAPFIAFLDADDEWLPHKLESQLWSMRANPGVSLVGCRAHLIDQNGKDLGDIYHGAHLATGPTAWKMFLAHPYISTPSVFTRRSALIEAGLFSENLPVAEDQDMWIKLAFKGSIAYVPEALVKVHSTPRSLTSAAISRQSRYLLPMVFGHMATKAAELSPRESRRIQGERFARVGQAAYAAGEYRFGAMMLLRAIVRAYRPAMCVAHLIIASPIARWAKGVIRRASS